MRVARAAELAQTRSPRARALPRHHGRPLNLPTTRDVHGDETADWNALLGTRPDGSDGYEAMSAEGPVSMRPHNPGVTITPGAWTNTLCSRTPGFADHAC